MGKYAVVNGLEAADVTSEVPIDLDDMDTWPNGVLRHVAQVADLLAGRTQIASDLDLDPEDEDDFREVLGLQVVRAYHCTRLLDHEVEGIRQGGLRLLSRDLVDSRISYAQSLGALTASDAGELMSGHVFQTGDSSIFAGSSIREGQIHLFFSRMTLDVHVAGIWRLLATWGGEGIYFTEANSALEPKLRSMGRPAIVVAGIPLSRSWSEDRASPGLLKSFVGRYLEFDDYDSEVTYRSPVNAESILDVWQPGSANYDVHKELPSL